MPDSTPMFLEKESPISIVIGNNASAQTTNDLAIVISDHSNLGQVNVRGDATYNLFTGTMKEIVGVEIPTEPNTVALSDQYIILWLCENEWLIITPEDRETDLINLLENRMSRIFTSFTDVSSGQCIIRITGPDVRKVLSKGCSLDLHPRSFGLGKCAQSLIAEVGVTIRQINNTPSFELIVRRSLAEYLVNWLYDAAQEFSSTQ